MNRLFFDVPCLKMHGYLPRAFAAYANSAQGGSVLVIPLLPWLALLVSLLTNLLTKTINQKYQLYFVKNQIQDYLLIGVDKGIDKIEDLYQEYLDIEIGNEDFHFMHLLKDK